MSAALHHLYAERAAYQLPLYTVRQAAHLTGLPLATTAKWAEPEAHLLVRQPGATSLSFLNLVELHVLAAIRRHYQVSLRNCLS